MSEYQYIHFVACDRPLDDKQLAYMELQSTRADISRWEFTNEYHFGGFSGNAEEMLRRGYDVHLHFANFGIRKLMFRLPELPCDKKTFSAFEVEYGLVWTKDTRGKAGVLSIEPEADAGTYDYLDEVHSMLSRLAPLREMLIQGDLRPLYLAWVVCQYDEKSIEPPVPAGLGKLDPALESMAEFYELSDDLLTAAAQTALPKPKISNGDLATKKWLGGMSKADLKQVVADLIAGDAVGVKTDLLSQIRQSSPTTTYPTTPPSRSVEELRSIADLVTARQEKREAIACDKARKKKLKSIANDPQKTILRIDSLAAERHTKGYHEIADHLTDLTEALGEEKGKKKAKQIAQKLRQRKPRSNVLIGILRNQGWID